MSNLLSERYHNQQRLYLMTCSMMSLVMLEVFLQMFSSVYDELRKISTPEQEIRRRVDLCVEVSNFVVSRASSRLQGRTAEGEKEDWPEAGSLFMSSTSSESSFVSSILKGASGVFK